MNRNIQVAIAGRDKAFIDQLSTLTREYFGCARISQHATNGHPDPLYSSIETPDLLILDLAADWHEQLGAICSRPASARPAMLVVGPPTHVDAMRMAMQAGARDYLSAPIDKNELFLAFSNIEREEPRQDRRPCQWTSIMGVKGGIGTSMIACNLAQLVCRKNYRTALLDLDLQTGSLASYLDLEPRNNFQDAIEAAEDLDAVALEGYMTPAEDGPHLLAAPTDRIVMPDQVPSTSLAILFDLIAANYERVLVDLPHHFDHLVVAAVEQSDDILLVTEQSVTAVTETLRIRDLLCSDIGLSQSRIHLVVNRFTKNAGVSERDIRKNLGDLDIFMVPNDFRSVRESLDIGIPIVRRARGSTVAKALGKLGTELAGPDPEHASLVSSLTNILRI